MKLLTPLLLFLFSLTAFSCSSDEPTPAPTPAPTPDTTPATMARGADVSWLTQLEAEGYKFYTPSGQEKECMKLLRDDCGVESVRLRVWVNPEGGWNGLDDTLAKARRAKALGLRLMIDFHFSDTWADPGKQVIPAAWQSLSFPELKQAVSSHVAEVLNALKKENIDVEWVQIGNETTPGMMLPAGEIEKNPEQYTQLNNAGYDAVKSVYPQAKVIVHLDKGEDQWRYDRMFGALEAHGGKYDMIGMSHYPYWWDEKGNLCDWRKLVADCVKNISYVKKRYGRPVMICEVGAPYNAPEAAREIISSLMAAPVEGVFYWEPEAPAGYNGGYNMGCFDNGRPTSALNPFRQ